jgi:predicted nucleic acid-binding protein
MARVADLVAAGSAATCGPIVQEVLDSTVTKAELRRLDGNLQGVVLLPVGETDWRSAAWPMYHRRRRGRTIPAADLLIATLARRHQAMLVHADSHFEEIAAFTHEHADYRAQPLATERLLDLIRREP